MVTPSTPQSHPNDMSKWGDDFRHVSCHMSKMGCDFHFWSPHWYPIVTLLSESEWSELKNNQNPLAYMTPMICRKWGVIFDFGHPIGYAHCDPIRTSSPPGLPEGRRRSDWCNCRHFIMAKSCSHPLTHKGEGICWMNKNGFL